MQICDVSVPGVLGRTTEEPAYSMMTMQLALVGMDAVSDADLQQIILTLASKTGLPSARIRMAFTSSALRCSY